MTAKEASLPFRSLLDTVHEECQARVSADWVQGCLCTVKYPLMCLEMCTEYAIVWGRTSKACELCNAVRQKCASIQQCTKCICTSFPIVTLRVHYSSWNFSRRPDRSEPKIWKIFHPFSLFLLSSCVDSFL